jgi:hypothetical protein
MPTSIFFRLNVIEIDIRYGINDKKLFLFKTVPGREAVELTEELTVR